MGLCLYIPYNIQQNETKYTKFYFLTNKTFGWIRSWSVDPNMETILMFCLSCLKLHSHLIQLGVGKYSYPFFLFLFQPFLMLERGFFSKENEGRKKFFFPKNKLKSICCLVLHPFCLCLILIKKSRPLSSPVSPLQPYLGLVEGLYDNFKMH